MLALLGQNRDLPGTCGAKQHGRGVEQPVFSELTCRLNACDVSVILSFLQEMLDKQRYTAAIAAFHAPIAGRSVHRDSAVINFLLGARRMNPPRPCTVPPWDLPTVLRALKGPPFEHCNPRASEHSH